MRRCCDGLDIGGGGGGGGSGGGDETDTVQKSLPIPAQIAATRAAFNTASGIAGMQRNLPHFDQVAYSPAYQQSLQNAANTWSNWMGTAPVDLAEGAAPTTNGPFGRVIDAGNIMNQQIAGLPPEIQSLISQWVGPGGIPANSPYAPTIYDPYINQPSLLGPGSRAMGGVGTIGAGGIPTSFGAWMEPEPAQVQAPELDTGTGTGTGTSSGTEEKEGRSRRQHLAIRD